MSKPQTRPVQVPLRASNPLKISQTLVTALLTGFCLFLLSSSAAAADQPLVALVGNGRAEYRFDYAGDRSQIAIALDAPGVNGVELDVYTPAQVQAEQRGEQVTAIGRGTPNNGHDSFWAGTFNAPGVYHVVVLNHTPGVILYRLTITGDSVGGVAQILADAPQDRAVISGPSILTVHLPAAAGPDLQIRVPGSPSACTPAFAVDAVEFSSLKLCPNQVYPPLRLVGNNLALYGDDARSAIVTSSGRQFAITLEGSNNLVERVTVQASADGADLGAWLCQYAECLFPTQPRKTVINGGLVYGGGILVRGSYNTVHAVTIHGGTIGIATVDGVSNKLLDNQLNDLNGWGSFNIGSAGSYFVGNSLSRDNHACTTPDGFKFLHGCETAGWICLACSGNVVAANHCESSGNCFYMSGERGLSSNDNKLISNYCAGATDNCFELTFSQGNLLEDNVTTADPGTGSDCNYPFWIGGSTVYFKDNLWQCSVTAEEAVALAAASTDIPTLAVLNQLTVPGTAMDSLKSAAPLQNPPQYRRFFR